MRSHSFFLLSFLNSLFSMIPIADPFMDKERPIAGIFTDSNRWVVSDDDIVYNPQNRSYKEVLLGGTPIEWFFSEEVPTIEGAKIVPLKIRFPRRDCESCHKPAQQAYDYIEDDKQVINNGAWEQMDKTALLGLPWIAAEEADKWIGINTDFGTGAAITNITPAGAIKFSNSDRHSYILRNRNRPTRLCLFTPQTDDMGWMTHDVGSTEDIEFVCVSDANCGLVYNYDKSGGMSMYNDQNGRYDRESDSLSQDSWWGEDDDSWGDNDFAYELWEERRRERIWGRFY